MTMPGGSLRFTFLGTGAPPVSLRRAGPAHLVEGAGLRILIDAGSGVSQRLVDAGTRGADIDALIITHYHSDHVMDVDQLVISSWHQGRARPWRIIAPLPVIRHLKAREAAWADERALRVAFEKRASTTGLEVQYEELQAGPIHVGTGKVGKTLAIEAFHVDHRPVAPAFGLIFSINGQRAVFTGDTRPCEALGVAAKGADLLVSEVYVTAQMPVAPGVRSAATVSAVMGYHMTPQEVAALAVGAGVKALALTHIVPPSADTAALTAEVRAAGYSGPLIVGEDLMQIDVGARMLGWKGASLGY
jgi:ribonuclease BN (tRNA processing enzyme)